MGTRTLNVEELTMEAFLPFGFYARMVDPDAELIGAAPIEFFRDMVQQDLGTASTVSFSTCRIERRDLVIDATEYHSSCGEGILPPRRRKTHCHAATDAAFTHWIVFFL